VKKLRLFELERGLKKVEVCKNLIYRHLQIQLYGKNKEAILSALENNVTTIKKMRKCDLGNVDQALME
jgi:hypothetical protein